MATKHATKENFSGILGSEKPVIVDFHASWCGPCRMMGPVFEELSGEMESRADFAKLSTEEEPELAGKHNVRSIPTLIVFKEGKEAGRLTGFLPKDALKAEIEKLI